MQRRMHTAVTILHNALRRSCGVSHGFVRGLCVLSLRGYYFITDRENREILRNRLPAMDLIKTCDSSLINDEVSRTFARGHKRIRYQIYLNNKLKGIRSRVLLHISRVIDIMLQKGSLISQYVCAFINISIQYDVKSST